MQFVNQFEQCFVTSNLFHWFYFCGMFLMTGGEIIKWHHWFINRLFFISVMHPHFVISLIISQHIKCNWTELHTGEYKIIKKFEFHFRGICFLNLVSVCLLSPYLCIDKWHTHWLNSNDYNLLVMSLVKLWADSQYYLSVCNWFV